MKIVGKRGSGKTSFLIGFLLSLVNNEIIKNWDVSVFGLTYNYQSQWSDTIFKPKNRLSQNWQTITKQTSHFWPYTNRIKMK